MQPEEEAKRVLSLMAKVSAQRKAEYENFRLEVYNSLAEVVREKLPTKDLSPTMASLALSEAIATILSSTLVLTAESLMTCSVVTKESKSFGDLFRRAMVDFLLEGTSSALHDGAMDAILRLDKKGG